LKNYIDKIVSLAGLFLLSWKQGEFVFTGEQTDMRYIGSRTGGRRWRRHIM
jgi:hypothetical protein